MVSALLNAIERLAIEALNAIIAGIAAALELALSVLPTMPNVPSMLPEFFNPSEPNNVLSWVAWFFPIDTLLNVLAFTLSMWLMWQIAAIALRWAKMLS